MLRKTLRSARLVPSAILVACLFYQLRVSYFLNKTMPINMYRLHVEMIGRPFPATALERVFEALDDAISASTRAIENTRDAETGEFMDSVTDDECDVLESLLGVAFVAAQTEVTATAARVRTLHQRFAQQFSGSTLSTTTGRKPDVFRVGSAPLFPPYTAVEALNAFANFFKHHDEWDGMWNTGTPQQLQTIAILRAAGAVPLSTGTLRTGARSLNVDWSLSTRGLLDIVTEWRKNLASSCHAELIRHQLL